jgi:hypothetical protein
MRATKTYAAVGNNSRQERNDGRLLSSVEIGITEMPILMKEEILSTIILDIANACRYLHASYHKGLTTFFFKTSKLPRMRFRVLILLKKSVS